MGWKTRHSERIISDINITPLADVMLVLLVIFMVATPLIMTDSLKIRLPRAASSDAEPGMGLVVTVSEKGAVALNGKAVAMGALGGALAASFEGGGERSVIVRADGGARHSLVVNVLDAARLAGAERLSIATEHERHQGQP